MNWNSRSHQSDDSDKTGHLCDTISRKTLFYLIATLNASFHPDYDFSNARSDEFSKEPSVKVSGKKENRQNREKSERKTRTIHKVLIDKNLEKLFQLDD